MLLTLSASGLVLTLFGFIGPSKCRRPVPVHSNVRFHRTLNSRVSNAEVPAAARRHAVWLAIVVILKTQRARLAAIMVVARVRQVWTHHSAFDYFFLIVLLLYAVMTWREGAIHAVDRLRIVLCSIACSLSGSACARWMPCN